VRLLRQLGGDRRSEIPTRVRVSLGRPSRNRHVLSRFRSAEPGRGGVVVRTFRNGSNNAIFGT